ncbi:MAG: hypothetical protein FGF48_06770 [Candidatus Brockarchaeota archaeon]|nr:hypothetical protein [Candidatus Brockarchaeota archaeon]
MNIGYVQTLLIAEQGYSSGARAIGIAPDSKPPIASTPVSLIIWRIDPEGYVCEEDDAAELDVKTTCAVRLDFRDPGSPEVVKLVPSWLSQCLTVYKDVKRIMLGEHE